MSLPLDYRSEVKGEIDEAYAWYEDKAVGLGDEFMTALQEHLKSIQDNPEMYAVQYRQVRAAPMHRFPYVAYYRVEAARIVVVAVQHGSRNPRRWRNRA